ncbi:zinc finger and SCAN domain-containing protein 31-like isoform X2 [Teleopsis dalmanni]|nr:zinc finger and SCAN domain-containing protein 31-like isoform X2 [Teleopsis dalmanni]
MEVSIKWNMCRICLLEDRAESENRMRSIFSDPKLLNNIFECAGVKITPNDALPDKICRQCLMVLRSAVQFRTTCRKSDGFLQYVVAKTKSATSLTKFKKNREETTGLITKVIDCISEEEDNSPIEQNNSVISNVKFKTSCKTAKIGKCSNELEIHGEITEGKEDLEVVDGNANENVFELIAIESGIKSEMYTEELLDDTEENMLVATMNSNSNFNYMEVEGEHVDTMKTVTETEMQSEEFIVSFVEDDHEIENTFKSKLNTIGDDSELECIKPEPKDTDDKNNKGQQQSSTIEICTIDPELCEVEFLEGDCSLDMGLKKTETRSIIKARDGIKKLIPHVAKSQTARICIKHNETYLCNTCGNSFTERKTLNQHMRIHRNERKYECELCFKRFNSACNLSAHMRSHTGERPYECKFCSRRFSDRSTHVKHVRTHTNEKPFVCTDCGKAFSLSTTLKAHEKTHTGEKPYRCEPCNKQFKLPHQLKAHQNSQLHKNVVEQISVV